MNLVRTFKIDVSGFKPSNRAGNLGPGNWYDQRRWLFPPFSNLCLRLRNPVIKRVGLSEPRTVLLYSSSINVLIGIKLQRC